MVQSLDFSDIKKRVVLPAVFITCKGNTLISLNRQLIRTNLLAGKERLPAPDTGYTQLSFLPPRPPLFLQQAEQWNTTGLFTLAGTPYNAGGHLLMPVATESSNVSGEKPILPAHLAPDIVHASITGEL